MPWFCERHILCLCYDPSAKWLLCCVKDALVIVPILALLDPALSPQDKLWPTDDVTEINISKIKGQVSSCKWWQTSSNRAIAVLATDAGYLYLVDLVSEQIVNELCLDEHISNISLLQNSNQDTTSLLITTKSNVQWKLLLEQRINTSQLAFDSELVWNKKGAAPVIKFHRQKHYISILNKHDDVDEMSPQELCKFPPSVILSTQHAKQQTMVASYDLLTNVFQVYESDMEHSPLYVYYTPDTTHQVILTDKLLFLTSDIKGHVLSVAANQLAEAPPDKDKHKSVIQQFRLGSDEQILSVYKHTLSSTEYNFNDHNTEDDLWIHAISDHTVLDGCIILTNKAIYVCRPRVSPEGLFLSLVYRDEEYTEAEKLAYILSLDVNMLYRLAAERCLADDCPHKAIILLHRARCPALERLELLVRHAYISEAVTVLEPLIGQRGSADLSPVQCTLVAQYATVCYVHLLSTSTQHLSLNDQFRTFLLSNYYLDKMKVLHILLNSGLHKFFVEFAQERDMFMEAIKLVLSRDNMAASGGEEDSPYNMVKLPHIKSHDSQIIDDLLQLLDAYELVNVLEDDSRYGRRLAALLQDNLATLSEDQLLQIATMLDISKHPWKKWLHLAMSIENRLSSESSDESDYLDQDKCQTSAVGHVIRLFLSVVIHLNHHRVSPVTPVTELTASSLPQEVERTRRTAAVPREYVVSRPTVLSCGPDYTAFVRNADLYTWGCTQHGRLGHAEQVTGYNHTPNAIKHLKELNVQVSSVACGGRHCLALTNKGVYSWGDNTYGQLGTGNTVCSASPVHVDALDNIAVSAITAGQYHSLALSADFRVYSWGWGVHGQLGHGDSEDQHSPQPITALDIHRPTMITAGCMHTVTLTCQGEVYTFGCSNFGQLGTGQTHKTTCPVLVNTLCEPVSMVTTRYFHNLALGRSGKLYCWGASPVQLRRQMALLRRSKDTSHRNNVQIHNRHITPSVVYTREINEKIIKICCGGSFSVVLTESGEVYTWGVNSDGQLATGDTLEEPTPTLIKALHDSRMVTIATGANFVVALDTGGELHSWGNNDKGQLGMRPRIPGLVGNRTSSVVPGLLGRSQLMLHSNSIQLPARVDTSPLSRVRNLRRYKEELAQAASAQAWWLEKTLRSASPLGFETSIPDLVGPGPVLYSPHTVSLTMVHLPQWCHLEDVLDMSVDLQQWHIAANMAILQHDTNKALEYHIAYIISQTEQLGSSYEDTMVELFRHYVQHTTASTDTLVHLCLQLLNLCHTEQLTVTALQSFVLEHKSQLAFPLFLGLVQFDVDKTSDGSVGDRFDISFLLKILQQAMQYINNSECNSLEAYIENLLPGHRSKLSTMSRISQDMPDSKTDGLNEPGMCQDIDESDTSCGQEPTRLSHDIVVNGTSGGGQKEAQLTRLSKDMAVRDMHSGQEGIHLTKQHWATLLAQCTEHSGHHDTTTTEAEVCEEIVAFSCGHHCDRDTLMSTLVPQLRQKLVLNEPPMTKTASLLVDQYGCSDKIDMGCPDCVYTALMKV